MTTTMGSMLEPANTRSRKDRPCDTCRRRKSKCVIPEGAERCVLCDFHKQDCTFEQSPQPRKRQNGDAGEDKPSKRRASDTESNGSRKHSTSATSNLRTEVVEDYANLKGPSLLKETLGLQNHRHSKYIGVTGHYEPFLMDSIPFNHKDEYGLSTGSLRKVSDHDTFLQLSDQQARSDEFADLDAIESVVAPHGQALINIYFRIVHPNFPILHKRVYLEKYRRTHREFSPPLLAAVYIIALNWWSYSADLSILPKPDVKELEKLALKTMNDVIHRPKLSTVQAGLLLLQRPGGDSWAMTAQLVAIAQDLGLHADCTRWKIPDWERGLRKRLGWALFMQDKWSSLIYGRPSLISQSNWSVQPVANDDFPETAQDEDDEEGSAEVEKGRILFIEMISLSRILAEILETFFSLKAMQEMEEEEGNATLVILDKAKPSQTKLKEWYTNLPECLKMESTKVRKLSSTGYLHLAYLATEITLHRCIVRSLDDTTAPYIVNICRSAARCRLNAAMDFVNALKPEHLQAFWYFASKINFALVGMFANLLWATSGDKEEAEFYRNRLGEFRWTLRVSSKGADFMEFAVGVLDEASSVFQKAITNGKHKHSARDGRASVSVNTAEQDHNNVEWQKPTPPTMDSAQASNPTSTSISPTLSHAAFQTGQYWLETPPNMASNLGFNNAAASSYSVAEYEGYMPPVELYDERMTSASVAAANGHNGIYMAATTSSESWNPATNGGNGRSIFDEHSDFLGI